MVIYNNAIYFSLKSSYSAPNKSKIPDQEPLWWKPLGTTDPTWDSRLSSLESTIETLNAKIYSLENDNSILTDQLDELRTQVQEHDLDIIAGLGDVLDYDAVNNTILFTGVNVQIVNGLGGTFSANGTGNLIVGYNAQDNYQYYCSDGQYTNENDCVSPNVWGTNQRSGSHNIVAGHGNDYTQYGSILGGFRNVSNGTFNTLGGAINIASGWTSNVVGGYNNTANGEASTVSGGETNIASGRFSSVSGGRFNEASDYTSTVSGGYENTSSAHASNVSGGRGNIASGFASNVSGGFINIASGDASSVSGGSDNESSRYNSAVSGGSNNIASGNDSSVSGGSNITMSTDSGWAAGSLREE